MNTQIDNLVYRSDLETTIPAYFPSKRLNYTAIILFLQKMSAIAIANFTISTVNRYYVANKCELIESSYNV